MLRGSDKDSVDFATRGQSTVIGFLAIVLSFSLVSAQANLHAVETMVSAEASQINQLDRLLLRYGDPKVAQMRGLLAAYAQSIVGEEWPLLSRGDRSGLDSRLSETFGQLSRAVFSIDPAPGRQIEIYNQIPKEMDGLSESRGRRIEAADIRLPDIFWEIIFALLVLLVALGVMIEPSLWRAIAMGGQAMAVALLLSLVFIYDQPFKGQTSVGPDAIVKALAMMKSRTS